MFRFRFNQIFVALLALSTISAFILPPSFTDSFRNVQKLFAPIAWPARKLGYAVRNRIDPPRTDDDRKADDVKGENERLRVLVLTLQGQLDEMKRINGLRELVGSARAMCTPFRVLGADPAPNRDSLSIAAGAGDGVEVLMPVLFSENVVGRIERVGAGGAQVQLVTDPKFQASARIYRYLPDNKRALVKTTQPLVRGAGNGTMIITNVPLNETQGPPPEQSAVGIAVGDYVVLDDPDWPVQLSTRAIGRVDEVGALQSARLFAHIRVRPMLNLEGLREVMVMNKLAVDSSANTGTE